MVAAILCVSQAWAIPAFPGAEGYGGNSFGGRGGNVYHVTSLADTNTPGTLRYGISSATTARTIVFDVSGTIALTSALTVSKNQITIAGQTAPGNGICLKNNAVTVTGNNVTVRHIHTRLGNDAGQPAVDAIGVEGGYGVILDHVSASWSLDEVMSISDQATAVTLQYCTMAEAMNSGGHSYGSLFKPDVSATYSVYHNLYIDNYSRNPRPGYYNNSTVLLDFRNNVVYNWQDQAGYTEDDGSGLLKMNYVGNYAINGPSGTKPYIFNGKSVPATELQIYQSGNKIDPNRNGILDGVDNGWGNFTGVLDGSKMTTEFPMGGGYPPVTTMTADAALTAVLNQVGAFPWNRDSLDTTLINQVLSYGTLGSIYSSVAAAGGWPSYPYIYRDPNVYDPDRDGMLTDWELAHGLDPNVADNNGDYDADGYNNLEEYLNGLAPIPAPATINWVGPMGGRYELIGNWSIPWQPALTDRVEINSGKAVVGYKFQEAGTLYVANWGSSSAALDVTSGGGLTVANALHLGSGSGARGTANVSGGVLSVGGSVALGGGGGGARGLLNVSGGSLIVSRPIILAAATNSTGEMKVSKGAYVRAGGLTISTASSRSSQLTVEVDDTGSSLIRTTGLSTLAGVLDVQSLAEYRPREADRFTVILSSDPNGVHYSGDFTSFTSNITRGLQHSDPNDPNSSYLSAFVGDIDGADYDAVFRGLTYGDINADHAVNGGDLAMMGGAWFLPGTWTWSDGDLNGDGTVDGGDLALMGGNWFWSLPAPPPGAPIPEPATLGLLALAGATLIRRRR